MYNLVNDFYLRALSVVVTNKLTKFNQNIFTKENIVKILNCKMVRIVQSRSMILSWDENNKQDSSSKGLLLYNINSVPLLIFLQIVPAMMLDWRTYWFLYTLTNACFNQTQPWMVPCRVKKNTDSSFFFYLIS